MVELTYRTVSAQVPIAVRDHGRLSGAGGGWRGDVVLLPAARGTAADLDAVAGPLRGLGYRPVAVEPRGHGDSGVGPWTWPAVLGDLADVVAELGLDRPAVIGHGLGGVIAALWGGEHPECPLVVSIDGHGNPTRPEQLGGVEVPPGALAGSPPSSAGPSPRCRPRSPRRCGPSRRWTSWPSTGRSAARRWR